jgi:hypothetical protein
MCMYCFRALLPWAPFPPFFPWLNSTSSFFRFLWCSSTRKLRLMVVHMVYCDVSELELKF